MEVIVAKARRVQLITRNERKNDRTVARKLAVLLHHLWTTGEVFGPVPSGQGAR